MKQAAFILAALFLLAPARAQKADDTKRIAFAGGAQLTVGQDSMSDKQVCFASTPMTDGAQISFILPAIFINLATDVEADYSAPAYLRIGNEKPIPIQVPHRPHVLYMPRVRTAAILRALYTQARIRVQFTEWPTGRVYDETLQLGDFAAAYDRGVDLCAWPKMDIAAVHPAAEAGEPMEEAMPPAVVADASGENLQKEFEWYATSLQRRLQQNWLVATIDPDLRKSGQAKTIVSASIARDGTLRDIRIAEGSGNLSMDNSCMRDLLASSPIAPLPSAFHGETATVKILFDLAGGVSIQ